MEAVTHPGGISMSKAEPDAIMTISEVSDYLKLAESTVYKLAQGGKLPARKVGGVWRFSRKGLEEWINRFPVEMASDGNAP